MQRRKIFRVSKIQAPSRGFSNREKGVEMIELALILPLLLLMLVGVLFYGNAWATKDKLDGAGRDAARVAVNDFNDTTNPQCGGTPCSVQAAASAAVAALANANIDTCGMSSTGGASSGVFTWTFTSGGCASSGAPWTMVVERAVSTPVGGTDVLSTRVTLNYPYAWNFVAVNPFGSPINLGSQTIMANLN